MCLSKKKSYKIRNIYVLGDSLSDTGGLSTGIGKLISILKEDIKNDKIIMPYPFYNDSFTNGKVFAQIIADKLNIDLIPAWNFIYKDSSYYKIGNNYAIAGSTTGIMENILSRKIFNYFNLNNQVKSLLSQHFLKESDLVFLQIGSNDILNIINESNDDKKYEIFKRSVENEKKAIEMLINNGALNILIINVPNIGKLPYCIQTGNDKVASIWANKFNHCLKRMILNFQKKYKVRIKLYNLYAKITNFQNKFLNLKSENDIINSAMIVNLKDVLSGMIIPKYSKYCNNNNINNYFFFDQFHPTKFAHFLVAEDIWKMIEKW